MRFVSASGFTSNTTSVSAQGSLSLRLTHWNPKEADEALVTNKALGNVFVRPHLQQDSSRYGPFLKGGMLNCERVEGNGEGYEEGESQTTKSDTVLVIQFQFVSIKLKMQKHPKHIT